LSLPVPGGLLAGAIGAGFGGPLPGQMPLGVAANAS